MDAIRRIATRLGATLKPLPELRFNLTHALGQQIMRQFQRTPPSSPLALPLISFLVLLIFATSSNAHHSVGGTYDETNWVEIQGTIQNVSWRNPHVLIDIAVTDAQGQEAIWNIEMASISTLRRRGMDAGFMQEGQNIRVYGPSRMA